MAHLWVKSEDQQWALLPLEADGFCLSSHPPRLLDQERQMLSEQVALFRERGGVHESWILLCGARKQVSVNGFPLVAGIRVLSDRDEIRIEGAGTLFFSGEKLARVEAFPGGDSTVHCARCTRELHAGTPAVRCSFCALWHHEEEGSLCWTYDGSCAECSHSTKLNARYSWTPENL